MRRHMQAWPLGASQPATAAPAKRLAPEVDERSLYRVSYTGGAHDGHMGNQCKPTALHSLQCGVDSACMCIMACLPGRIAEAHTD